MKNCFEKSSGNYSAVQSHAAVLNNELVPQSKAISQSSLCEGIANIAGLRGFQFTDININDNIIYLSADAEGCVVGDTISIVIGRKRYIDSSTIVSIQKDILKINGFPFGEFTDNDKNEKIKFIFIKEKPEIGNFDIGYCAHAEGAQNKSINEATHSEGMLTTAVGPYAHSEGLMTSANYMASHSEGFGTVADNDCAHAEGQQTIAQGHSSHSEGEKTNAGGDYSHSEGYGVLSIGEASHAEGAFTITQNQGEHAEGMFNISNSSFDGNINEMTVHSVGVGTSDEDRKNAIEIMRSGDIFIKGIGGYDGTNAVIDAMPIQQVLNAIVDWIRSNGGNI